MTNSEIKRAENFLERFKEKNLKEGMSFSRFLNNEYKKSAKDSLKELMQEEMGMLALMYGGELLYRDLVENPMTLWIQADAEDISQEPTGFSLEIKAKEEWNDFFDEILLDNSDNLRESFVQEDLGAAFEYNHNRYCFGLEVEFDVKEIKIYR